jgi:cystathionine gamma-synthase
MGHVQMTMPRGDCAKDTALSNPSAQNFCRCRVLQDLTKTFPQMMLMSRVSKLHRQMLKWNTRMTAIGGLLLPSLLGVVKVASFSQSSSSSAPVVATPGEMGRRAEILARQQIHQPTTPSMETILSHSGIVQSFDSSTDDTAVVRRNEPLAPPLHLATTYTRPSDGQYRDDLDAIYTREDNPTRLLLERDIARLETHGGGIYPLDDDDDDNKLDDDTTTATTTTTTCAAFASGMMAVSSIVLAHQAPLHVIVPLDLYHGVPTVLLDVFSRFQVSVERVNFSTPLQLEAAVDKAVVVDSKNVIVWIETPSNPLNHVIDIASTCQRVRRSNRAAEAVVTVVVDSTLAPPTVTQPLRFGADLVLHSATKYLAGHSDALLGVVTASPWTRRGRELAPRLREVQTSVGGVASPLDAWLTLRGLRTLAIRVQRQCETAQKLANYLSNHPSVYKVYYPGLNSALDESPQHQALVERQMKMCGGMLSVDMDSESKAMALAGALRTIQRATSLGGTETLIEHRASIEPPGRVTSPVGLLRIAVGLEDVDDLIKDLQEALAIVDSLHS